MARKRVDLKAAKAAKQKKIAIGGGLLLVALLIVSVPRTMKLMHPHHGVAPRTAAAATSTTQTATTTTPTAASPSALPAAPVANTSAAPVLTARLAPAVREGQLASLSASFKAKDPFKQLIDPNAPTSPAAAAQGTESAKPAAPTTPATELKVVPSAKPAAAPAPAPVTKPAAAPKVIAPLLSALIAVNGDREGVNLKLSFPAGAPLFHLLSLTKKTARVSVVGGSLVGAPTLTLRLDRPVTLVNTADGTRYELELLSTSTKSVAAKKAAPPKQAPTSTTPTTTAPTTTTTPADTVAVPALGG